MLNVIMPVFVLIVIGMLGHRWLGLEARTFARLTLYIMSPALILNGVLTNGIGAREVGGIAIFTVLQMAVLLLLGFGAGRLLRLGSAEESTLLLTVSFPNAANYGLPVVLFALGQAGFDRGLTFAVISAVAMATVGVFLAARGGAAAAVEVAATSQGAGGGATVAVPGAVAATPLWRVAVGRAVRMPLLQAALLGIALRLLGITLPDVLMRPLGLLATAGIPLLVLVLGMQIDTTLQTLVARRKTAGARGARPSPRLLLRLGLGIVFRLALSPVIAVLVTRWVHLDPVTAQVLIIQAAMPLAVNMTILAIEFECEPDVVATTTVLTTALSLVSVSVLLEWLL